MNHPLWQCETFSSKRDELFAVISHLSSEWCKWKQVKSRNSHATRNTDDGYLEMVGENSVSNVINLGSDSDGDSVKAVQSEQIIIDLDTDLDEDWKF